MGFKVDGDGKDSLKHLFVKQAPSLCKNHCLQRWHFQKEMLIIGKNQKTLLFNAEMNGGFS